MSLSQKRRNGKMEYVKWKDSKRFSERKTARREKKKDRDILVFAEERER